MSLAALSKEEEFIVLNFEATLEQIRGKVARQLWEMLANRGRLQAIIKVSRTQDTRALTHVAPGFA